MQRIGQGTATLEIALFDVNVAIENDEASKICLAECKHCIAGTRMGADYDNPLCATLAASAGDIRELLNLAHR